MTKDGITYSGGEDRQDVPPYLVVGKNSFGFLDELHGEQGCPCPDYIPTKLELELLAQYWAEVKVAIERMWSECESVGSSDSRQHEYASHRLSRIASRIGNERVLAILKEEMDKYSPAIRTCPPTRPPA